MENINWMSYMHDLDKNPEYEKYLTEHINAVQNAYGWLKLHLPELLDVYNFSHETAYYGDLDEIIAKHDQSKYRKIPDADNYYELTPEYDAYANYFYGKQTAEVKEAFDRAWLAHIHANPHHWQHWVLHNDEDGTKILDMPYVFIIEMICDHWSFSWRNNNLYNIFDWYDKNKKNIMFSKNTRKTYEHILSEIRRELDAENGTNS